MSHLRAPAKINLGLKITGVRKDGYHLLKSLFAPVSLYDEISIRPDPPSQNLDRVLYVVDGHGVIIPDDTVTKALDLFRQAVPTCPTHEVVVQKAIPMGAGLGGGSADAGAILSFLHRTYAYSSMTIIELKWLALKIGADVPFFLDPQPAWVSGIGERIEPVKLEPLHVLICKPPFGISTPEAFGWYDQDNPVLTPLHDDATPITGTECFERQEPQQKTTWTVRQVIENLENDLEKPVETRHPETQEMRLALRQWGALGSLMSGTGSSVYGLFRNQAEAVAAREKLKPRYPSTYSFFICETVKQKEL